MSQPATFDYGRPSIHEYSIIIPLYPIIIPIKPHSNIISSLHPIKCFSPSSWSWPSSYVGLGAGQQRHATLAHNALAFQEFQVPKTARKNMEKRCKVRVILQERWRSFGFMRQIWLFIGHTQENWWCRYIFPIYPTNNWNSSIVKLWNEGTNL